MKKEIYFLTLVVFSFLTLSFATVFEKDLREIKSQMIFCFLSKCSQKELSELYFNFAHTCFNISLTERRVPKVCSKCSKEISKRNISRGLNNIAVCILIEELQDKMGVNLIEELNPLNFTSY